MVKNPPAMQETWVWSWVGKIPWIREWQSTLVFLLGEPPWTEEPGGLQSMGSQRVGHDWVTKHSTPQSLVPGWAHDPGWAHPALFIRAQWLFGRGRWLQSYYSSPRHYTLLGGVLCLVAQSCPWTVAFQALCDPRVANVSRIAGVFLLSHQGS